MMIQVVEKDFMDPIENTDTNNCVLATEINKQEPVHQGNTLHKVYKQSADQYWQ